jgi:hypothetical protein
MKPGSFSETSVVNFFQTRPTERYIPEDSSSLYGHRHENTKHRIFLPFIFYGAYASYTLVLSHAMTFRHVVLGLLLVSTVCVSRKKAFSASKRRLA